MLSHVRAAALGSATFAATGALALSLLAAPPAQAAPAPAKRTTASSTPTTTPASAALKKAQRQKARKQARKRYEKRVRTKVVRLAKSKVGRARYVAGAAGPNRFDCSGLSLWVWRKAAGRNLPHYSVAQAQATRNVKRHNLKRGDLVFFFRSGAHHVGIYIGRGRMVGAANPRSGIKIDSVFTGWYGARYSGAGRLF